MNDNENYTEENTSKGNIKGFNYEIIRNSFNISEIKLVITRGNEKNRKDEDDLSLNDNILITNNGIEVANFEITKKIDNEVIRNKKFGTKKERVYASLILIDDKPDFNLIQEISMIPPNQISAFEKFLKNIPEDVSVSYNPIVNFSRLQPTFTIGIDGFVTRFISDEKFTTYQKLYKLSLEIFNEYKDKIIPSMIKELGDSNPDICDFFNFINKKTINQIDYLQNLDIKDVLFKEFKGLYLNELIDNNKKNNKNENENENERMI